jgi:hypothetical protein
VGIGSDPEGRTIWIVDAHRDNGKKFVARSNEKLTAFLNLNWWFPGGISYVRRSWSVFAELPAKRGEKGVSPHFLNRSDSGGSVFRVDCKIRQELRMGRQQTMIVHSRSCARLLTFIPLVRRSSLLPGTPDAFDRAPLR